MKKEKTYNEAVDGDEGFVPGEGYPSCDGEPCANVSDDSQDGTDTMADAAEGGDKAGAGSDLTAALAEWQDKFIRLQAEFDNYRKRTLKEKMDLVQTGGRDVLLAMLPVRDDVQRAVDAMQKSDDIEALRAGVMLISQKFTDTLRQKGVTEIDVKGKEFDADLCEAAQAPAVPARRSTPSAGQHCACPARDTRGGCGRSSGSGPRARSGAGKWRLPCRRQWRRSQTSARWPHRRQQRCPAVRSEA